MRFWAILILVLLFSCKGSNDIKKGDSSEKNKSDLNLEFTKYKLANGLEVILHQDKSDPVVSLNILIHAGSNREKPGKTGFAHFFEHMLFQVSENMPEGYFFKKLDELGGTFNGGTWTDGTVYYETVPKDALEKILWMEADRMGFFINAVTQKQLEEEKPVVKNEKRQRNDNQAYGHTDFVTRKYLYPEGHPYSWPVIGSLEDLENATLEDVKEFYNQFYGPNNATLVLVGDFETDNAKKLIEKYFGEIKAKTEVKPLGPMPAKVEKTKRFYHLDNFAKLPEIRMVFPSVELFNNDQYALDALGQILSDGKRAALYKVIVEEKKLAPRPYAFNSSSELAGNFIFAVRGNAGISIDSLRDAVFVALERFEKEGFSDKDLERIKAGLETQFYNGISSVANKAYQLAYFNTYAGDPSVLTSNIRKIQSVTREDIIRVYNKYVKSMAYLETQFVPKNEANLVSSDAVKAEVIEEAIVQNVEKQFADDSLKIVKTASSFDRSKEPELGDEPLVSMPKIWKQNLNNGVKVSGIQYNELPLVQFSFVIKGGQMTDSFDKLGLANLVSDMMTEGTAKRSPEELEDEIGILGATIQMYTTREDIVITANTLARNYEKVLALVEEILMEPRWDLKEFERIKAVNKNQILQRDANPNVISGNVYSLLLYGEDNIFAYPTIGTIESIDKINIDDLKNYHKTYIKPQLAHFQIVGQLNQDRVVKSLASLESRWMKDDIQVSFPKFTKKTENKIFFIDFPGAKQSVIRVGYNALNANDPNYNLAKFINVRLGDGTAGQLFQILREQKGYTYGAYSSFQRGNIPTAFTASSSVRSNVTAESVQLFKEVISNYVRNYSQNDVDVTRKMLIRQNTSAFENIDALLGLLAEMNKYGLSDNYIMDEQNLVKNINLDQAKTALNTYLDVTKMFYLIVGDAATQLEAVKKLKIADVILLDKNAKVVKK